MMQFKVLQADNKSVFVGTGKHSLYTVCHGKLNSTNPDEYPLLNVNNFLYAAKTTACTPTFDTKFGHSKVKVTEDEDVTLTMKEVLLVPNVIQRAITYTICISQMIDRFGRRLRDLLQGEDPHETLMKYISRLLNYDNHFSISSSHEETRPIEKIQIDVPKQ